jgi:hypothetical protein
LNSQNGQIQTRRKTVKQRALRTSKEIAYVAVFVALVIAAQLVFAMIPGLEVVTVLFVSYAFAFGVCRGMLAATAFSLLRQLVFGFVPSVLALYLLYFNFLTLLFGLLGRIVKRPSLNLWWLVVIACVCTALFSMLDNLITPFWLGYGWEETKKYFVLSLPVMFPQIGCTGVTVGFLLLPLVKAFRLSKRGLQ